MTDIKSNFTRKDYINFCLNHIDKVPRSVKLIIGMIILDADIKESEKKNIIPDYGKTNPAKDGTRIFLNDVPDILIKDIYSKISNCLKFGLDTI